MPVKIRRNLSPVKKIEVNGENESPLFTYLKSQKGFAGFAPDHPLTPVLESALGKMDPDYANNSDIKWNFTKFLIYRRPQAYFLCRSACQSLQGGIRVSTGESVIMKAKQQNLPRKLYHTRLGVVILCQIINMIH